MNRLESRFRALRQAGQKALLPYITGGYPDPQSTVEILKQIDPQRCACVEVGIPFSDPIADGPVIQASFSQALDRGFQLDDLFAAIRSERAAISLPLLAMVSYSIVYRRSPEAFVQAAVAAGFDGLIVPDLALEEADQLAKIAGDAGCPLVMMVAPTTDPQRRQRIAALSDPFIYYQSLAGVTGERTSLPTDLIGHVEELRNTTGKPICVGFGISTADHVRSVCQVADGAIVGSALVRRIIQSVDRGDSTDRLTAEVIAGINTLTAGLPPTT